MSTILMGWEMGSGLGHVAMMIPLAKALQQKGHQVVMALHDIRTTEPLWKDTGLKVVQSPRWPFPETWDKTFPTETLADILMLGGYGEAQKLFTFVNAWGKLMHEVKPDLVICESCTCLPLVSISNVPTLSMGTGFTVPPHSQRLPNIRFWKEETNAASALHENAILRAFNSVRKKLKLEPFEFVGDVFAGDQQVVCVLPELDCYDQHRKPENKAIGPLTEVPAIDLEGQHPRQGMFAYLNGVEPRLPQIIAGLEEANYPCDAYIRNLTKQMLARLPLQKVRLYKEPQPMPGLLPQRKLLLHHGGMSTTDIALRCSTPQIILSRSLEQLITTVKIRDMGVGLGFSENQLHDKEEIGIAIQRILQSKDMQNRSMAKAIELNRRLATGPKPLDIALERCQSLLKS